MSSQAIRTMRNLAKSESELMDGFGSGVSLDDLPYSQYVVAVENLSKAIFSFGRTDSPFASKMWGNGAYIMPLPLFLVVQSNPIVDIPAEGEEKIIESFGVTAEQLRDLAAAGLVELNLLSERHLDKDNPGYCHDFHTELLNPTLTGCKVNGIRRRKLFETIGFPKAHQDELLSRYRAVFRSMLDRQGLSAYNAASGGGAPAHNIDDAVEQLSYNAMYLNLLGPNRGQEENDPYLAIRETDPLGETVAKIRGRKAYLCSPITANFGGTTNFTPAEYQHAHQSFLVDVKHDARTIDAGSQSVAEFVLAFARARQSSTAWNGSGLEFPIAPKKFNNVLSFLKDNQENLEKTSVLIEEINNLASDSDRELSLKRVSQIYDDIVACTPDVSDPLMAQALAGAAGAAATTAASKAQEAGVKRLVETKTETDGEEEVVDIAKRGLLKSVSCAAAGAIGGMAASQTLERAAPEIPIDTHRSRTIVASFFDDLIIRRT